MPGHRPERVGHDLGHGQLTRPVAPGLEPLDDPGGDLEVVAVQATWLRASSATSSGSACWLKNSFRSPRLRNWGGSSVGSASQAASAARPSAVIR